MAKAYMGARVMFCNHAGWFVADIWKIGNTNIVHASKPVSGDSIIRTHLETASHQLRDFPNAGFWKPQHGVFAVPEEQVTLIRKNGGAK